MIKKNICLFAILLLLGFSFDVKAEEADSEVPENDITVSKDEEVNDSKSAYDTLKEHMGEELFNEFIEHYASMGIEITEDDIEFLK